MRAFRSFLPVSEALGALLRAVEPPELASDEVRAGDSLRRFAAEDVLAAEDVPPFDRSVVDGYAVVAEDTFGSSQLNPAVLEVVGEVSAGERLAELRPLRSGQAVVIHTGGPIPPGSNAVVMVEHTRPSGSRVEVFRPVAPYENVSKAGEDFRRGEVVVRRGALIRPWHIAAMAAAGLSRVRVLERLRVSVVSTGGELSDAPGGGPVRNSTKPLLLSLLAEDHCEPLDGGTVGDSVEEIREALARALAQSHAAITTGGTSVGPTDLVAEAVRSVEDSSILFHGLAIRPGRPTGAALVGGKPVFMLSGFPVAAYTGYLAVVRPVLYSMRRSSPDPEPVVEARLWRRVAKPVGVRAYVRVMLRVGERGFEAEPLMLTGSGLLSTLTEGNGLLVIPESLEGYEEGEVVRVILLGPLGTPRSSINL